MSIPSRESYEGTSGWQDGRLGQAYDLIDAVLRQRDKNVDGNPLYEALHGAMCRIEQGDITLGTADYAGDQL